MRGNRRQCHHQVGETRQGTEVRKPPGQSKQRLWNRVRTETAPRELSMAFSAGGSLWGSQTPPRLTLKRHLHPLAACAKCRPDTPQLSRTSLSRMPWMRHGELVQEKIPCNLYDFTGDKPSRTAQPCSEAPVYLQTHSCTYIHVNKIQGNLKIRFISGLLFFRRYSTDTF